MRMKSPYDSIPCEITWLNITGYQGSGKICICIGVFDQIRLKYKYKYVTE